MSDIKMSERFGSVPNFDIKEFFEDDQLFAIPNVQSCYDDINKAVNNHDRLVEENAELRKTLQSALNIKNLWLPETNMIVHTDEFCALHKMHDSFKKLL